MRTIVLLSFLGLLSITSAFHRPHQPVLRTVSHGNHLRRKHLNGNEDIIENLLDVSGRIQKKSTNRRYLTNRQRRPTKLTGLKRKTRDAIEDEIEESVESPSHQSKKLKTVEVEDMDGHVFFNDQGQLVLKPYIAKDYLEGQKEKNLNQYDAACADAKYRDPVKKYRRLSFLRQAVHGVANGVYSVVKGVATFVVRPDKAIKGIGQFVGQFSQNPISTSRSVLRALKQNVRDNGIVHTLSNVGTQVICVFVPGAAETQVTSAFSKTASALGNMFGLTKGANVASALSASGEVASAAKIGSSLSRSASFASEAAFAAEVAGDIGEVASVAGAAASASAAAGTASASAQVGSSVSAASKATLFQKAIAHINQGAKFSLARSVGLTGQKAAESSDARLSSAKSTIEGGDEENDDKMDYNDDMHDQRQMSTYQRIRV